MHGHNYDVLVEIEGSLTPDSWVFDFVQAKKMIAAICRELDHRFLLPMNNPALRVEEHGGAYEVRVGDRRYVMPTQDVVALPIDNSTAERLAEWLAGRIAGELPALGTANLSRITVGVEEAPGQAGWYSAALRLPAEGEKREGAGRRRG